MKPLQTNSLPKQYVVLLKDWDHEHAKTTEQIHVNQCRKSNISKGWLFQKILCLHLWQRVLGENNTANNERVIGISKHFLAFPSKGIFLIAKTKIMTNRRQIYVQCLKKLCVLSETCGTEGDFPLIFLTACWPYSHLRPFSINKPWQYLRENYKNTIITTYSLNIKYFTLKIQQCFQTFIWCSVFFTRRPLFNSVLIAPEEPKGPLQGGSVELLRRTAFGQSSFSWGKVIKGCWKKLPTNLKICTDFQIFMLSQEIHRK